MESAPQKPCQTREMSNKKKSRSYPEPYTVEASAIHEYSLILLHGRGSNGERFGKALMESQITTMPVSNRIGGCGSANTLAECFPKAKFIFPTAKKRRAKWYNRATINQWFDSVPIDEQDKLSDDMSKEEEEWRLEGLRESRAFLVTILDAEVALVGASNVFIGGLSQGCAMTLHLFLSLDQRTTGDAGKLGGFVGMSGWLPFADAIEEILDPSRKKKEASDILLGADIDDAFANSDDVDSVSSEGVRGDSEELQRSNTLKIFNFVRESMDLPQPTEMVPAWMETPVFLGHGKRDEKVTLAKGVRAAECLRRLRLRVTWKEYDEGHWYKVPDELDDIASFLQDCMGASHGL